MIGKYMLPPACAAFTLGPIPVAYEAFKLI